MEKLKEEVRGVVDVSFGGSERPVSCLGAAVDRCFARRRNVDAVAPHHARAAGCVIRKRLRTGRKDARSDAGLALGQVRAVPLVAAPRRLLGWADGRA